MESKAPRLVGRVTERSAEVAKPSSGEDEDSDEDRGTGDDSGLDCRREEDKVNLIRCRRR